jgi:hypothetical protein
MHVHDSPRMAVTVVCFLLVAINMFLQISLRFLGGHDVVVNGLHAVEVVHSALTRPCTRIPLMVPIKPLEPLSRQDGVH